MLAKINNGWIRCGQCGHKLARVVLEGVAQINFKPAVIEIKCSSCKELNTVPIKVAESDD